MTWGPEMQRQFDAPQRVSASIPKTSGIAELDRGARRSRGLSSRLRWYVGSEGGFRTPDPAVNSRLLYH